MAHTVVLPRWVVAVGAALALGGFATAAAVVAFDEDSERATSPTTVPTSAPALDPVPDPPALAPTGAAGPCSMGPREHRVLRATSGDGLAWTLADDAVAEHASVPDAVVTADGDVLLVFVDASTPPETAALLRSTDGGRTFEPADFSIEGLPEDTKVLDPNLVVLPDGRIRLYYFGSPVHGHIDAGEEHTVYSAISDDGEHFVQEGPALTGTGLVDPDVFAVGDAWVMYVFGGGATLVAHSADGRTFTEAGPLSLTRVGTTGPITLDDGRLRLYGFEQVPGGALVVYDSDDDGATWQLVEGFDLELPEGTGATDPQVVALGEGEWLMVLKLAESCAPA
ncbi:MAG: exo-alpha-sialidase [Actinobacteria bacterium]|nr:exo-alpha-sialidase [Actinomycetota bacterium]